MKQIIVHETNVERYVCKNIDCEYDFAVVAFTTYKAEDQLSIWTSQIPKHCPRCGVPNPVEYKGK